MTIRVPLQFLRIKANVAAGLNPLVLYSLAHFMRSTTDDPPPAVVRQNADEDYTILDGRHRYVAAIVAGRADLLCAVQFGGGA